MEFYIKLGSNKATNSKRKPFNDQRRLKLLMDAIRIKFDICDDLHCATNPFELILSFLFRKLEKKVNLHGNLIKTVLFFNLEKQFEPLWKEWDKKAQKEGLHSTFYTNNKDEYIGEWHNNKKEGKGIYNWVSKGEIFEGEWKDDKRNGFGGWKDNKQHGYGTYYYSESHYYEGEWYAGLKSGWGRMYYSNGDIYEGEWSNDKRHGNGMLRLANDNRYEGEWKNDMKNGHGNFFFLNKGQLLEGFWVDDINKTGKMIDFDRDNARQANIYELPAIHLKDAEQVLEESIQSFKKN
ncbi:unnamed protein product [Brachionus calyciflorus]|uniref:MORN repeat-containing protein 3 n=1 Tax=Brachionus calyciflorus TaxID=104777 RepID=A0A813XGU9_9BILA|nr:unnamed protein product [Brachionus calyciflorus]